jgi:hypothetical protein
MVNKLVTLLFTSVLVFSLSVPVFSQEEEEAKETPAQEKAERAHNSKQARVAGIVLASDKDRSALTVRQGGTRDMKVVHYDSSTQWTSQEHGKQANNIDPSEVKEKDRVICKGHYDKKGEFHATLISKRLTEH